MKFASTEAYRSYNGYTFVNGHPVDVTDKATIAALVKDSTMRRIEDEERQGQAPAAAQEVLTHLTQPAPEYPRRAILRAKR